MTGKEYKPTFEDETENDGQQMVMILIDTFIQHMYVYIPMHTCVDTGNLYIACYIARKLDDFKQNKFTHLLHSINFYKMANLKLAISTKSNSPLHCSAIQHASTYVQPPG